MKNIIRFIKSSIRSFLPTEVRIIRESVYVDLMRFFGKTTKSITIKEFPVYPNGEVAFYKYPFLQVGRKKYFAQIYGTDFVTDVTVGKRAYVNYTSEILIGELYSNTTCIKIGVDSVLPVSIINKETDDNKSSLNIKINDSASFNLKGFKQNRFHYLPISANSKVNIKSDADYIVGSPIATKQDGIETNKKLVLSIFIDGLASKVFENIEFERLMPNTYKYFENGSLFFNCYANSNWTLPSVGSIFSGRYLINHKLYHPSNEVHIGDGYPIISDYFKNNGYLTAQFCSNFRKSPAYNYSQGFDRTVYRHSMGCDEIITKSIEHLRAFSDRSNYLWLTLFETHHFLHGIPDISNQIKTKLDLHGSCNDSAKSPFSSFDKKKSELYLLEVQRIDFYLKILFDYIEDNYDDDEVVVAICSDHGKGYLDNDEHILAEHRIQVPMFFKSSELKPERSTSIIENIDFLPSLLQLSGIKFNEKIDGSSVFSKIPRKQYAISESFFPHDKYHAAVYSKSYCFYLESNEILELIDDVNFQDCSYVFVRKSDGFVEQKGDISTLTGDAVFYFDHIISHKNISS
jgi:hypothetical protein